MKVPTITLSRRKKICLGSFLVVALGLYFFLGAILDIISFHDHYGHFLGSKPYEYYSRQAFNERVWGDVSYNMSSCTYQHFPVAERRADGTVMWNTPKLNPLADQHRARHITIHLYRNRTHTPLILEWLWHSILDDEAVVLQEHHKKYFPRYNVTVVRINTPHELQQAAERREIQYLLLMTSYWCFPAVQKFLSEHRIPIVPMGAIMMSDEGCNNPPDIHILRHRPVPPNAKNVPPSYSYSTSPVVYGRPGEPHEYLLDYLFLTYGDCHQVDNTRVRLWPLGPDINVLTALDANTMPKGIPMMSEREYDASLIGSLRSQKISRVQAIIAFREMCKQFGYACVERTGLSMYAVLGSLDDVFHTNYAIQSYFAQHFPDDYMRLLFETRLTLSPAGTTSECGRSMEAVMGGSIPVIEVWKEEGISPLSGPGYKCLARDHYSFYADSNAPVLWAKDWREAEPLMVEVLSNPKRLQQRQAALHRWYQGLLTHLRTLWFSQARAYLHPY
eukprot:m.72263 g.72263  ORF g.72263 m.72263 type:complete len:503 (-) comp12984_c0_seq1:22-1530(-)